jgi:phosphomevalonate kinase
VVVNGSSSPVVSAPGKLMISGEYAVLAGAEAIVAAVDRRAHARVRWADAPAAPAEARAAFAQVERALGALGYEPTVDVSELRSRGVKDAKLGLGSSAAAAAAAAGLALLEHGQEIASPAGRRKVFDAAWRGHQDVAPIGSGADVAASVYGGFIRFVRHGDEIQVSPLAWPAGLRVRVVWTGQEARTSTFLERVAALAQAEPAKHAERLQVLKAEAARFVRAVELGDTSGVLASTEAYGRAMGALGEAAGIQIVNDTLRKVAELAQRSGGAAKPSGAGGGDVAIALFPDQASERRFQTLCEDCKFTLLLTELGAPGVRLEDGAGTQVRR